MRKVASFALILCALCLSASRAEAQGCTTPSPQTTPPTFTCQIGVSRSLAWDYTFAVLPEDAFRVYVDNAQIGPDIVASTGTNLSVQFGATLPAGKYTVVVSSVRPGAAVPESKSAPVSLVMVPPNPQPPSNLRIVEVIMRGKDVAGNVIWEHRAEMAVSAQ